jgi:cyclase
MLGDPVELAQAYNDAGGRRAGVFWDITATHEDRDILIDVVYRTADQVFHSLDRRGGASKAWTRLKQFAAGGGPIRSALISSAVRNPDFINAASDRFGAPVHCGGDRWPAAAPTPTNPGWDVYVRGGRENTGLDAPDLGGGCGESGGAGETAGGPAMGRRRQPRDGYDLTLTRGDLRSGVGAP